MAWTQHGHQIIGTIAEDPSERPPVARCGGPKVCQKCGEDETMAQLAERLKRSDHTKTPSDINRRAHIAAYNTLYAEIRRTLDEVDRIGKGYHPETVEIHHAMVNILGKHAEDILREGRLDPTFLHDFLDNNRRRDRFSKQLNMVLGWLYKGYYLKVNHHECEALGLEFSDFRYIQTIIENETDYVTHHVWIDKEELYVLAPRGASEKDIAHHGVTKMADLMDIPEGSDDESGTE